MPHPARRPGARKAPRHTQDLLRSSAGLMRVNARVACLPSQPKALECRKNCRSAGKRSVCKAVTGAPRGYARKAKCRSTGVKSRRRSVQSCNSYSTPEPSVDMLRCRLRSECVLTFPAPFKSLTAPPHFPREQLRKRASCRHRPHPRCIDPQTVCALCGIDGSDSSCHDKRRAFSFAFPA
jgi:hypothetical protein